tara:strand:+ start:1239 stop:2333 length:1095 start_codon:yes stop_codon:yes gene_type:complete
MSIPLVSNVGFTEISQSVLDSNSGILNDIAGTAKSKLPVQLFKLTETVSGNLQINNDSSHKKIILDTNGNDIANPNGSPLTNNSSTTLELKGSGNVQSTLKTSNVTESSTSNLGTSTFGNSNSSTIVVSNIVTDLTVEKYIDRAGSYAYDGNDIDSLGTITVGGSTPNAATIFGTSSASSTRYNINISDGDQAARFIGDTATGASTPVGNGYELYIATIGPNTVSSLRMDEYSNIGIYQYTGSASGHNRYSGTTNHQINYSGTRRLWWRYVRSGNDRRFVFTNNLSISCTLSGTVLNGDTPSSGGTALANVSNSTDGSFNVTMTISGSNSSFTPARPYALATVNNGSGSIDTSAYTGTLSTRAF